MHIWHHAKTVPSTFSGGVNFAISFVFWDYIFRTAHIPKEGRDIELGFEAEEALPQDIGRQLIWPLKQQRLIIKSSYNSRFGWGNGHLQTIVPALFRSPKVIYQRNTYRTNDNDELSLDWIKKNKKSVW